MRKSLPERFVSSAFAREFGFEPVSERSADPLLRAVIMAQRLLEREIVALHLGELWRILERYELEMLHREPPSWLKNRAEYRQPNRQELEEKVNRLRVQYTDADNLAKGFGLHPEQPFRTE